MDQSYSTARRDRIFHASQAAAAAYDASKSAEVNFKDAFDSIVRADAGVFQCCSQEQLQTARDSFVHMMSLCAIGGRYGESHASMAEDFFDQFNSQLQTLGLFDRIEHETIATSVPQEQSMMIPSYGSFVQAMVCIQQSPVVAIMTHPWGPMGGSMWDPHPRTAAKIMAEAGCSTVRFDFGWGNGVGSGNASIEDVKSVAAWFTSPRDGNAGLASQVVLIGYSYGSVIAAAASSDIPECIGYAAVCPPLDYAWGLYMFNSTRLLSKAAASPSLPKLLVLGSSDIFCSVGSFRKFVGTLPEPKMAVELDGVTHFDAYPHLQKALVEWVVSAFHVADLKSFSEGIPPEMVGKCSIRITVGSDAVAREGFICRVMRCLRCQATNSMTGKSQ
eukprot:TRINITY_DN45318_c0_g1_i1.p1 TRINITY_DN45318_c0_g1~~TRINITY_DN45318_c0_g1_i1.p1  ORF type:complete len:388 (-),score=53.38 TRINITY_DN45318_c0_g1_i1:18-1181(-)